MKKTCLLLIVLCCSLISVGCDQLQNVSQMEPDAAYVTVEEQNLPMYETYAVWEEIELGAVAHQ